MVGIRSQGADSEGPLHLRLSYHLHAETGVDIRRGGVRGVTGAMVSSDCWVKAFNCVVRHFTVTRLLSRALGKKFEREKGVGTVK